MKTPSELAGSARALWRDTSGLIAPYVAVMLPVLVGFSMLAVDASRFMSLQTQMQAAADNLALAGARELNKQSGAQTRAVSAMANAYASAKSANTTVGMGSSPTLTYTHTFYSSLNAASSGIGGTAATGDGDSKYVSVTVAPQTVSTIFPASFLNAVALNSFSAGASAVAGFGGISLCGVAPIFICNPYETSGMTDAAATAAINTAWADAATLRKQMKLSTASTPSPGNFGWVVTAGCTNSDTTCLRKAILNPKGACYNKTGIYLNTGSTTNNMGFFDTRFDIYSNQVQPGNLATPANSPPAINVRKGYLPQTTGGKVDWCKAATVNSTSPSKYYTYPNKVATTATETGTGSTGTKKTLTNVGNATGVDAGDTITSAATGFPTADTTVSNVAGTGPYTVTMSNPATASATINVTFDWNTSGLPEDKSFTGFQGNGDWDCANYWDVNHHASGAAAPSGCTASNPTISRYQIYRDEISNGTGAGGINDWSGNNGWTSNGKDDSQGTTPSSTNGNLETENGAPYCAGASGVSPVDTSTGGLDRRTIIVPIINCLAQAPLPPGNNANNVPVAAFGKFFLTQPYSALADGNLYGEMTGALGSIDKVTIFNLVQLYR